MLKIKGSVNTLFTTETPIDLNAMVEVIDFLENHSDELMSVSVDGQSWFFGTGESLLDRTDQVLKALNPGGNQLNLGTVGDDTFFSTLVSDTLVGGPGDDTFILNNTFGLSGGTDIVYGGEGEDTAILDSFTSITSVTQSDNKVFVTDEFGNSVTLIGIENAQVGGQLFDI